jgi:hypothetical protein
MACPGWDLRLPGRWCAQVIVYAVNFLSLTERGCSGLPSATLAPLTKIGVKTAERREKRWFIRWLTHRSLLASSQANRKISTGGTATGQ